MRFYDPTKGATDSNRNIRYSAKGEAKWRRSGVAHISSGRVVDFAADALVETVVAGFSYAIEIRAQIIEDLDELSGFLLREEDDDEDEDEDEA